MQRARSGARPRPCCPSKSHRAPARFPPDQRSRQILVDLVRVNADQDDAAVRVGHRGDGLGCGFVAALVVDGEALLQLQAQEVTDHFGVDSVNWSAEEDVRGSAWRSAWRSCRSWRTPFLCIRLLPSAWGWLLLGAVGRCVTRPDRRPWSGPRRAWSASWSDLRSPRPQLSGLCRCSPPGRVAAVQEDGHPSLLPWRSRVPGEHLKLRAPPPEASVPGGGLLWAGIAQRIAVTAVPALHALRKILVARAGDAEGAVDPKSTAALARCGVKGLVAAEAGAFRAGLVEAGNSGVCAATSHAEGFLGLHGSGVHQIRDVVPPAPIRGVGGSRRACATGGHRGPGER